MIRTAGLALALTACGAFLPPVCGAEKPNIVFILADDLGYGDLGCYGQAVIRTPRLDRMAADGIRFTQFYAGATVCAPSRSVLMTGLHGGHTRVRANGPGRTGHGQELRAGDVTVAEVLHQAGYATALVGKWGLGEPDQPGGPNAQGFDSFFGFADQTHAHNHFPNFLWRNRERIELPNDLVPVGRTPGAGYSACRVAYAGDRFADEALAYIDAHTAGPPFFLFLSLTMPHANNERTAALGDGSEVPDYGEYAGRDWSNATKGYAAMVARIDTYVGRLLDRLREKGLDERTAVFFSSDNGPHHEGGQDLTIFDSNGPLRGWKRDLTEGGLRVPFVARWPGRIPAGTVSHAVGHFADFLATASELAGFDRPAGLDSISLVPVLTGRERDQPPHPVLYWEFHERGFGQAVLIDGRWKAIVMRPGPPPDPIQGQSTPPRGDVELYDLASDPGESHDLAAQHPAKVAQAQAFFRSERSDSDDWPAE